MIHTVSACVAAGLRQSLMMPMFVRLWVVSDTLVGGAPMRGMVWSSLRVRALCLALCRCWASLGGGCTPACFGFLLGRSAVWKGGGPVGDVKEGGVRETSPCCPCVQCGRGVPLRLYGVPLVLLAVDDETVWCCQFLHLGGVGEVVGDGDLGGVVLAGGGVWDDVVGCPLVSGAFPRRVQFEWGVEWFWRRVFSLGFHVRRYFGFNQVSCAPGLRGPHLGGCRCRGLEEGGGVGVQGGGSRLGSENVVGLVWPPTGVASLGVALWGWGLGLLDG